MSPEEALSGPGWAARARADVQAREQARGWTQEQDDAAWAALPPEQQRRLLENLRDSLRWAQDDPVPASLVVRYLTRALALSANTES